AAGQFRHSRLASPGRRALLVDHPGHPRDVDALFRRIFERRRALAPRPLRQTAGKGGPLAVSMGDSLVLWLCRPNLNLPGIPVGSIRIHPDVLAGVLVLVGLYFAVTGALRARCIVPSRRQRVSLTLVILILLVAEVSPLHDIAEGYLFSFHMIQHILLIMLLPPLLLAG